MGSLSSRTGHLKQLLAGGAILLAVGLFIDLRGLPSLGSKSAAEICPLISPSQDKLSRQQLARLLAVPEGDTKSKIQQIVKEPACHLPRLQVRVGATAERDVYPLEFDAQTWLVVLYEGDQYAGYRFLVR